MNAKHIEKFKFYLEVIRERREKINPKEIVMFDDDCEDVFELIDSIILKYKGGVIEESFSGGNYISEEDYVDVGFGYISSVHQYICGIFFRVQEFYLKSLKTLEVTYEQDASLSREYKLAPLPRKEFFCALMLFDSNSLMYFCQRMDGPTDEFYEAIISKNYLKFEALLSQFPNEELRADIVFYLIHFPKILCRVCKLSFNEPERYPLYSQALRLYFNIFSFFHTKEFDDINEDTPVEAKVEILENFIKDDYKSLSLLKGLIFAMSEDEGSSKIVRIAILEILEQANKYLDLIPEYTDNAEEENDFTLDDYVEAMSIELPQIVRAVLQENT